MSRGKCRSMALLFHAFVLAACTPAPGARAPFPAPSYTAALVAAQKRADTGDYAGADRILADFALRASNKSAAHEISFWRALYLVDPANRTGSTAEGIRALDIYLNTPGTVTYRPQAQVLKRTAMTVQALRLAAQPTPRTNGRDTVFVNREEEVASLRDQLAKANAELERIKKRLANPER